jgi:uncharacterized repeat protein (TIGR03803 family)
MPHRTAISREPVTKNRIYLFLLTVVALGVTFCAAAATRASAQTFTTLFSFDGTNGTQPVASLIQGFDGSFYGTTASGGTNNDGTVFSVSPGGAVTTLYNFCDRPSCADGSEPIGGLVQASDGNFYGTTYQGGFHDRGTVFRLAPSGALTTLHSFGRVNGASPLAALIQGVDGDLYGTTYEDGAKGNFGTIFKISLNGKLTTLYSFDKTDGANPLGVLVQAVDGNLYGTTANGGTQNLGTVFKITPSGTLTTLWNFDLTHGAYPEGLVQALDGHLYGITELGGDSNRGTVFKISTAGTLMTLHSFDATDGDYPEGALIQATDASFYGTTGGGGSTRCNGGCGTIFKITSRGKLTPLHRFIKTDGSDPYGSLIQGTDGSFYGTTDTGGSSKSGTVFNLSLGLGSFVRTLTASGKVGATVIILGTNLTGSTSVTFNGTAAAFTAVSSSEITATVPSGATSGVVSVTTPGGVLNSNQPFQVKP